MKKQIINSTKAPKPIGPYSHSVLANGNLYISGQLGVNPESGKLKNTLSEQTTQSLINLGSILEEAHMSYEHVNKTTLFITDMAHFSEVNDIYHTFFTENYPARSCVAVKQLPMNALFEIEVIASI